MSKMESRVFSREFKLEAVRRIERRGEHGDRYRVPASRIPGELGREHL